jgi:preprotein translocase subunit SecE
VTTFEARNNKRGFFTIYKPGQGKWVRWGTVAAMALLVLTGTYWLVGVELATREPMPRTIAGAVWTLVGAAVTFWLVNSPKMAEFLIMTESEMRKVSWPTRKDVIQATKVVIFSTIVLGIILYLVDVFFLWFFQIIGVA